MMGRRFLGSAVEGGKVEELWKAYREDLEKGKGGAGGEAGPANPIPTHPANKE